MGVLPTYRCYCIVLFTGHALKSYKWAITSAGWCWTTSLTLCTSLTLVSVFAQVIDLRIHNNRICLEFEFLAHVTVALLIFTLL